MTKFKRNNIKNLLKTSLDLANEAIYLIDSNGKILLANTTACQALGYDKKEVSSLNVFDVDALVKSKDEYKEKFELFKQNKSNNASVIESIHKRKDGTTFPVEISSRLIDIDGKEHLISYVLDISHRVKQDEELKLYFEFIKESSDMIFLVDFQSQKIEFANEKVCKTLEYSLEELKQMRISQLREGILDSAEIPEVFKDIKNKKNMITYGKYIGKNNNSVFVETSLSLKNYHGKDYIMAISRDISERLEIEKQREALNRKLENYNNTLKEEVAKIKSELTEYENIMQRQAKMAAMGEMLENIAHQWRQPLSIISVLSTGMKIQNDTGTLDKQTLTNGLNDINTSSQYLSKTIDDFSNFFKPSYKKTKFNISEVIKYTINLTKTNFKSQNIKIVENIIDLEVYTFKNELIQVLLNILNNAGDELIKLDKKRKLIMIETYENDEYLFIKVLDNAGGIKKSIVNRVFEPYFTTKHKSQGTGVGLYMCETIVKKHMQGLIEVENKEFMFEDDKYTGAQFILSLPKN
ncbi:PAS domain-containing sensor histidine kinase [Arcobacter roscoffensis]|uniref:histidine kinase n=1 Tax=Arcobacter roscoffensis TaxID=2961520 RepID=A0ABY5E6U4_9BACT|nr:PAS domain-containing sensor histidine kinase [Arcobacter roscoffensis]UTJ07582.1 PAS domain-containing sensor histidine kinase [Arcobacter roscoffensis]